jgi:hypothetical protein
MLYTLVLLKPFCVIFLEYGKMDFMFVHSFMHSECRDKRLTLITALFSDLILFRNL